MLQPTFVLVHGACHGPYYWGPLIECLAGLGHHAVTVDLPSTGPDRSRLGDLSSDAAVVRAAVGAYDEAIVVGHSYGGLPMTRGLAGLTNVRRLVYVSAFMLAENEALSDVEIGGSDDDWVASDDGATITVRDPAALFYNQCPPDVAATTGQRLMPQSTLAFTQPVLRSAWRTTPSTYVVCDDDQAIPPDVQLGMAKRAHRVHTLASDHTPFLSHPLAMSTLLSEIALT